MTKNAALFGITGELSLGVYNKASANHTPSLSAYAHHGPDSSIAYRPPRPRLHFRRQTARRHRGRKEYDWLVLYCRDTPRESPPVVPNGAKFSSFVFMKGIIYQKKALCQFMLAGKHSVKRFFKSTYFDLPEPLKR